jgi:hypothetical protein
MQVSEGADERRGFPHGVGLRPELTTYQCAVTRVLPQTLSGGSMTAFLRPVYHSIAESPYVHSPPRFALGATGPLTEELGSSVGLRAQAS